MRSTQAQAVRKNPSAYVQELIRHDQTRLFKIAIKQKLTDDVVGGDEFLRLVEHSEGKGPAASWQLNFLTPQQTTLSGSCTIALSNAA